MPPTDDPTSSTRDREPQRPSPRPAGGDGLSWFDGSLLVLGLVLVGLGLVRWGVFDSPVRMAWGETVEPARLGQPAGAGPDLVVEPGGWTLLLVGTAEGEGDLVLALDRLLAGSGDALSSLRPMVLLHDGAAEVGTFVERTGVEVPVAALDAVPRQELERLGIHDHGRRVALLDPGLRVAFHSRFLQPRDLFLLLDKHFSLAAETPTTVLAAGDRLGDAWHAPRAVAGASAVEAPGPRLWIVLTAACRSCALENHLRALADAQEMVRFAAEASGREAAVLFSASFDAEIVARQGEAVGLTLPAYVARRSLPGVEHPLHGTSLQGSDVVVVATDASGRVESVDGWAEHLGGLL